MLEAPLTRASLLIRIRDSQDREAWRQFVEVYGPVVYAFARKRGLQDADAADLMQEVLRSVVSAAGRLNYNPKNGSFRGWLYTVSRNKIYNFLDAGRRQIRPTGDSSEQQRLAEQAQPEPDLAASWDEEYERHLASYAMERVRGEFQPGTWQAFWLTAVEGQPARQVGQKLSLSPGAVYVARSRVLARLKEEIQKLQEE